MIYVFNPNPSHSARLLASTLGAKRLRNPRRLHRADIIVNWGSRDLEWARSQGVKILNGSLGVSKWDEIYLLNKAKLPTPPLSKKKEGPDWYPRSAFHSHGTDFLRGVKSPAFFVQRLKILDEYRLHVFKFKEDDIRILRWGKKVPRGPEAHEWVRSDVGGWRLSYGLSSEQLPKGLRPVAKDAISKLDYDWGAVDMGLTSFGKPVIFEVNSAPGLDEGGKTIQLYAEAIREHLEGK